MLAECTFSYTYSMYVLVLHFIKRIIYFGLMSHMQQINYPCIGKVMRYHKPNNIDDAHCSAILVSSQNITKIGQH